jgi:hypothetical protein
MPHSVRRKVQASGLDEVVGDHQFLASVRRGAVPKGMQQACDCGAVRVMRDAYGAEPGSQELVTGLPSKPNSVMSRGVSRMWGDSGASDMIADRLRPWGLMDGVGLALG